MLDFAILRTNAGLMSELAAAINARLDEVGLTMSEWKRRSGVSDVKLREMRDGTRERWTLAKERQAEAGLGWVLGSFEMVRNGKQPIVATSSDGRTVSVEGLSDVDAAIVASLVDVIRALRAEPSEPD
jgi:hypothetical protein